MMRLKVRERLIGTPRRCNNILAPFKVKENNTLAPLDETDNDGEGEGDEDDEISLETSGLCRMIAERT